jgi:hypothetical protein
LLLSSFCFIETFDWENSQPSVHVHGQSVRTRVQLESRFDRTLGKFT